jgi:mannose-1-phosphate guanylyltransferase
LGIKPTYAGTGYGYIQRGDPIPERVIYPVYHVSRFREKPDEDQARAMISTGDHSWNSGMFVWRVDVILAEIERQMVGLSASLSEIEAAWKTPQRDEVIQRVWPGLKNETVDYGIMEHAEKLAVLPAGGLEWSDVGSWDALFDVLLPDKDGNIVFAGQHIAEDTHDSLVYGNRGERLVVTIGVDDLIIVDSGDVLLVCHKNQAQKVRNAVDTLKKSGLDQYL